MNHLTINHQLITMDPILTTIITSIWTEEIKNDFADQGFMWEHHLQAVFYFHLRNKLPTNQYEIWVEPVFKLETPGNDLKPDLLITKGDYIVAVIELKFKPWEYAHFRSDLDKLKKISKHQKPVALKAIPVSPKWGEQKEKSLKEYTVQEECLLVFGVVGHPDSYALTLENETLPTNFLHLTGQISNEGEPLFVQNSTQ